MNEIDLKNSIDNCNMKNGFLFVNLHLNWDKIFVKQIMNVNILLFIYIPNNNKEKKTNISIKKYPKLSASFHFHLINLAGEKFV